MKIAAPRGTQDIFGAKAELWQFIENTAAKVFAQAGFSEIRTPIFESTELFDRAVGEESDIVNKEMYTFADRSERSLTLRPEGTASVVRAFVENNLDQIAKPQKLWYRGPMFRYERPQTGRYRQFHQIGIEALGSKAPYIDLEVINMAIEFLKQLGLQDLTLYVNSIGNSESRKKYIDSLKIFLNGLKDKVCEDCQRRIDTNPLRCLDCKVPHDQELYKNAPVIIDFFDEESNSIWKEFLEGLNGLKINYKIDNSLVRGLDYYSHCVFEVKTSSATLGMQSTVLAGGRYDSLIGQLGGPDLPAVGWACGLERMSLLIEEQSKDLIKAQTKVFVLSDNANEALKLAIQLRNDLPETVIEFDYEQSKFKKQLEKALKRSYDFVLFWLEDERNKQEFKIKNLKTTEESSGLSYSQVLEQIKTLNVVKR